ncbi:MAG: hypothetical protein HND52_13695 [Ignavibacteriae bacterium]|nr:hypothetical protein [Ignavibacteriota bacterium]NOG99007.1 hypothetical protein [Ignavibacteriota bacterium]
MKSTYIKVLCCIVFFFSINLSLYSKDKVENFAEDYGEKFVEAIRKNDTAILKQLFPSAGQLNQFINSLPTDEQNKYRKDHKDLADALSTIEETVVDEFNNSQTYMTNEFPVIPLGNIKLKSTVIDNSEKSLVYTEFATHKIDITFSVEDDGFDNLFDFPTYALLTDEGFFLVDFYVEYEIQEIATEMANDYAKNILEIFIENNFERYQKNLRPTLKDVSWHVHNRLNPGDRKDILSNPADWGFDEKTFNTDGPKYFDDNFRSCVNDFNEYINVDSIKNYKFLDCSFSNSFIPEFTVTSIINITFSIEYLNDETRYYMMGTGILQSSDEYYFGAMGEIDVTELDDPINKQPKYKIKLPEPEPAVLNESKIFWDMSGRACPKASFNLTEIKVNYRGHQYAKVIESSDKLIDCPNGITYDDMILAYRYRGDSYMQIYNDSGTSYFTRKKERIESDPKLLVEAIKSYNNAFEVIERGNIKSYESKYADLCSNHYNAVAVCYNYAIDMPDSLFAETRPYYEAVADGAGYATENVEQMKKIKALAGYYAGFSLVNENNNLVNADRYLSMAVPLDESLLSMNRETLISRFLLDEKTSQTVYDYLGVACYRLSAEYLDIAKTHEISKMLQEALEFNKKAEKCFKIILLLAPEDQETLTKLNKTTDLHTEIQNVYKKLTQ